MKRLAFILVALMLSLSVSPNETVKQRIKQMQRTVPMQYNQEVQTYVDRYLKAPGMVSRVRGLSLYYFPIIEQIFRDNGLPTELKYLTLVESKLNPQVVSPRGAAGLWQFMPESGKAFGLQRNAYVDDRLDTYRATEAAAKLLKRLYGMYGDWAIVIAAYNCGSGTIRGAIKAAGGKKSFWAIYPYLPKQTRIYMPIFIAYNYVLEYADAYNIQPATIDNLPAAADTIHTTRRLNFQQIARTTGTPVETIRMMNPQYLQGVTPAGRDNIICLPQGKARFMRKHAAEAAEADETKEETVAQQ
ncbi:MAG: lytic transglycosylase domain-containing protein [Paludibacteraceae bacterium]|nr:lytic transglycosylase domain-containing protein [Paludibacteraceae bacterium]